MPTTFVAILRKSQFMAHLPGLSRVDSARANFIHDLADRSAKVILPHFRKVITVDDKDGRQDFDPVTVADRSGERVISQQIAKSFPEDGVIGEEYGTRNAEARFRWIVDPIDGTRAFIIGQPLWGTLIGLLDGETPVLGLMNQPFTGERFYGSAKGAFFKRGAGPARRLKTRSGVKLSEAILAATHPDLMKGDDAAPFARLKASVRMSRFGGDCYNYAMVAAGFIDIVAECGLQSYDIVAHIPIIEAAGGVVTTWDGGPATNGGRILASGDPKLHERALKVLSRA